MDDKKSHNQTLLIFQQGLASKGSSSPTARSGRAAPRNRSGSVWISMCCRRRCDAFGSTNPCTKALTKARSDRTAEGMGWSCFFPEFPMESLENLEVERTNMFCIFERMRIWK